MENSSDSRFNLNEDFNEVVEPALEESSELSNSLVKPKVKKPGVVYLNYIPRYMTVKLVREYFNEFGEVRRLFLKPERNKKPGKPSKFFCEGWLEFGSRKVARQVAECLNGTQVGGKRHTPYYDALWSIKYLKKFQWSQLNEKQAYKKAQKGLRMRTEIAQAKREVDFYTRGVEKQKHMKRKKLDEEETNSSLPFHSPVQMENNETPREEGSTNEKAVSIMKSILI
ncbi:hypothetical protein JTE90_026226 [Oedothorax gibbosus]|uniref:Activator of basal transcription 1 n=1 Tax=Oedothorax gibbosus TaxID=931172 RepID=A0AAV6U9H0_9ARAC|nr:hypothetical protein JTE90_026226 [Oedothorax gibbosus]